MPRIAPCLWFDGQAEAAAEFYVSVFKNSRILQVARNGQGGPGPAGSVLTVNFLLDGQEFIALNGGPQFTFSEAVSFTVYCDTQAEIDYYWEALAADGGEEVECGWLRDKFGLSWQIVPSIIPELLSDPNAVDGVMQAVMRMRKLDIAALMRAAGR